METVLKHRTLLEDMAIRYFSNAHRDLAVSDARLTVLNMEYQVVSQNRSATFDFNDLVLRQNYLAGLKSRISLESQRRSLLSENLEIARQSLVARRQDRQSIEYIKENDHKLWLVESAKAEQSELDDVISSRRVIQGS